MKRLKNIRPRIKRPSQRSRRLAGLGVVCAVGVVIFVTSMGASEGDTYKVRANFKTSSGITEGADVRVAGANVGTIERIFVTEDDEAGLVLKINDPAFGTFYADAKCRIRLQSLIGEKFVDCEPGTPTEAELPTDPTSDDRVVLESDRTSSPVDTDELLDAMREPQRERFRVIINELGITLTGRGQDLQDILKSFDPTFKEVNDILKILARQNDELETLAVDGDKSLQELADNRKHITSLFKNADKAARATNAKRAELAETLRLLPAMLDELEPTMKVLEDFSNQAAPVAASARAAAPDLSTFVTGTNEFVDAANPALTRFGQTADVFRQQIPALQPLANILRKVSDNRNTVTNFNKFLSSFEDQNGYKNLAALAFGMAGALNGSDSFGHFTRSALVLSGNCFSYQQTRNGDCAADFGTRSELNLPPSSKASASSAVPESLSGDAAALDYLMGGER